MLAARGQRKEPRDKESFLLALQQDPEALLVWILGLDAEGTRRLASWRTEVDVLDELASGCSRPAAVIADLAWRLWPATGPAEKLAHLLRASSTFPTADGQRLACLCAAPDSKSWCWLTTSPDDVPGQWLAQSPINGGASPRAVRQFLRDHALGPRGCVSTRHAADLLELLAYLRTGHLHLYPCPRPFLAGRAGRELVAAQAAYTLDVNACLGARGRLPAVLCREVDEYLGIAEEGSRACTLKSP